MLRMYRRSLLSTSFIIIGFSTVMSASAAQAFDPNAELAATAAMAAPVTPAAPPATTQLAVAPAVPLYPVGNSAPAINYVTPLPPIVMPQKPLYPTREGAAMPVASPLAAPGLPPVDPAVEAQARAIMAQQDQMAQQPAAAPAQQPVSAIPQSGFIAPAPLMAIPADQLNPAPAMTATAAPQPMPQGPAIAAVPAATPMPVNAPQPLMPSTAIATQGAPELSDDTRKILSHVPSSMNAPKPAGKPITMDRVSPEVKEILSSKDKEDSYEAVGLSIKVRRPGLDTNYELSRAYTALMGGDTQTAVETYKNILSVDPRNEDALFGLAATYHRLGEIDKARPLYGMLLQVNPNHREGLNNFLVLVSDESPQDALPELQRLEERNPDFSPIPAQIAIVLDKLNYPDAARDKMLRAIELAPENLSYKYNLAVMLDRHGQYADATALYRNLIEASLAGAPVPASTEVMQKRLNYLVTQATSARTATLSN
jgi:Flp pilus assembly protein TadD